MIEYHAYTDGTDWIVGTSFEEAVEVYRQENPDFDANNEQPPWPQVDDDHVMTINEDSNPPLKKTATIREHIADHFATFSDGVLAKDEGSVTA
jgi:hypothetical protein